MVLEKLFGWMRRLFGLKKNESALTEIVAAMNLATRAWIDDDELLILMNRERKTLGFKPWSWKVFDERVMAPAKKATEEAQKELQEQEQAKKDAEEKKNVVVEKKLAEAEEQLHKAEKIIAEAKKK